MLEKQFTETDYKINTRRYYIVSTGLSPKLGCSPQSQAVLTNIEGYPGLRLA